MAHRRGEFADPWTDQGSLFRTGGKGPDSLMKHYWTTAFVEHLHAWEVDGRGRRHGLKHGLSRYASRLRDGHAVDAAWRPNRRGETGMPTTRVQEDGPLDGVSYLGGRSMRPLPKLRQMSAIAR